ncbi:MAG TPA: response regulator [Acidisarcina sp.]|nr:response regulator [Acidisarcina sp.]
MKRITLLVDDNAVQAATRKAILERAGQRVAVATDGFEALSLLENPEILQRLGLIISDHLMPGMNGPELVRRIREAYSTIPILILSGLPNAEEEYRGMNVVFRNKPFPPDALISLSRELLDEPMSRTA